MTLTLNSRVRRFPGTALLIVWTGMVGIPLYVLLVSTFKSTNEIFASPMALPKVWNLDNFVEAWSGANFSTYTINSLVVAVAAVALTIVLGALAAYPLSRYKLWWTTPLLGFFLAGIMVPARLASVEMFGLVRNLGLIDNIASLGLVFTAIRLPFAVFILANFMRSVPNETLEAARLDGAPEWRLLFQVVLPQIKAAVGIVAVFTAIAVWNDFYFPLILLFSTENYTLPLGISQFIGQFRTNWGLLFAGLTLSLVPLLVFYALTVRRMREGIQQGILR